LGSRVGVTGRGARWGPRPSPSKGKLGGGSKQVFSEEVLPSGKKMGEQKEEKGPEKQGKQRIQARAKRGPMK